MTEPQIPVKVKIFVGIITGSEELLYSAEKKLIKKFGAPDFKTMKIPFTHTNYYNSIGSNLYRVFISFEKLHKRDKIVQIKLYTNKLEKIISEKKRKINIDPGYLTLSNVFLASCKDYFHRIYLGKGVFLENEYRYVNKKFEPWEWTYPDYTKPEYMNFFYNIRSIYYNQIKKR